MKCIVCNKELEYALGNEDDYHKDSYQPYAGLEFFTYGHYGSTYFDPINGNSLRVCICDECVEKAFNENVIVEHVCVGNKSFISE